MQEIYNWKSLQVFFSALNNNVEYLVLRNYEDFIQGELNSEHPDIDILCKESKELIHYSKSESRTDSKNDLIHQRVMISNKLVSLDVRHVGDGYYDEQWELDMLKKRCLANNLCYVLDDENYYYSLLYHTLIQKMRVSSDYEQRLTKMGREFSIDNPVSLDVLQSFMRKNKYHFTYPENPVGIANFSKVDKTMIDVNIMKIVKRKIYKIARYIKK